MFSLKAFMCAALLAALVMVVESSSQDTGSDDSAPERSSNCTKTRKLYLSKVHKAERVCRPVNHCGFRLTLKDGTQWLVHKDDKNKTVVTDAKNMSSKWKVVYTMIYLGKKNTVSDFVRAGGSKLPK